MPYLGGRLSSFVSAVREVTAPAACSMAETGGLEMLTRSQRYTPVDTGEVRHAWHATPVERVSIRTLDGYEVHVQNTHWRAHWAEWGTSPHRIEPEDEQAITTPEGPRAGAEHPGYRGAHMMGRAAAEVETEFPWLVQDELSAWAKAAEQNARRRQGIS